ncbi:MAG: type II CRISPR-associated endonuclease Cas1 [Lentisphaeria bacterium]|nr:type II CRISPR-associated endonuclease Cas1 [Lentisphaeria bacterium]
MTDRIIEIAETAAFLSLENQLLKIRLPDGQTTLVPTAEIQCLILANPAITATGAVLSQLAESGAIVVVSGKDRLPTAMQLPLNGNYIQNERFRAQVSASLPLNKRLWQTIVKEKIKSQGLLLKSCHGDDFSLLKLSEKVNSGDTENLEGRAALIYWKNLFDKPFLRERESSDNNLLLNYGYAVLRAMAARACCGAGLHPTLGINHHNRYNPYCLADDIMEPYRWIVDKAVVNLNPENFPVDELTKDVRKKLIEALLEPIPSIAGICSLSDVLRHNAVKIAESFQRGELKLRY